MTTPTETAEIIGLFDRLDDNAKLLMFEVINGMSRGLLTGEEVEATTERMLAGADKVNELETLVDLLNHRIYDEALNDTGVMQ